jgi:transcription-repair coupling factor (superfamily II helicase)
MDPSAATTQETPAHEAGRDRPQPRRIPAAPPGAAAAALARMARDATAGLLVVEGNEREAADLAVLLRAFQPGLTVLAFPPWDSLPGDRLPPSAAVLGRRAAVFAALEWVRREGGPAPVVIATPEALVQAVPEAFAPSLRPFMLVPGEAFDEPDLVAKLLERGYWADERVDEPGEFSARAGTFDLFPADAEGPIRIEHEAGRIVSIRVYDPGTQRSLHEASGWLVVAAREAEPGRTGRVPARHVPLATLLPDAAIVLDPAAGRRAAAFRELVDQSAGPRPAGLYATPGESSDALAGRQVVPMQEDPGVTVPRFVLEREPAKALACFVQDQRAQGRRVVVAAPHLAVLRRTLRSVRWALGEDTAVVPSWADALSAEGAVPGLVLPLSHGFIAAEDGIAVLAAADLLGARAAAGAPSESRHVFEADAEWSIGDAVVHREHGIAVLQGLEAVQHADGRVAETIRLAFAGDEVLLLPVSEGGHLWRYGSSDSQVKPDTLHGSAWRERRDKVAAEIEAAARLIAERASRRDAATAPVIEPDIALYERFAARFPFRETPDQAAAIADVLDDLRRGRPMDRLVCGDVGFGKTEVALRAAAAVALAGRQVAVAAPTTLLARQHAVQFRRRFAGFGVEVAELSRFTPPAEARAVKEGLASGRIRVVVGTHAVAGKGVAFADLALVVIDEEQRFGQAHKRALKGLAPALHVLAMTATPIPRTLRVALAGLRELSVIATPPVARRPVRTVLQPYTPEALAEALRREAARGGQSFVVCPTIEEMEPLAARLAEACPELEVLRVHARMPAQEIDEAMLRFAEGECDCLLSTSIVESGLDVPNANTMVIWRPDRYGLAQLHQLRGRVGRGRATGFCVLMPPDEGEITRGARRRLNALVALDRPGAGFAVAARDLDQRGAGDLFGTDQSGHLSLIGAGLARHLTEVALRRARGESVDDEPPPEIGIADRGGIPAGYVAEEEARLNLYLRLARLDTPRAVEDFGDELDDRFGPAPPEVERLLAVAALTARAAALRLARIDIGPQGVAAAPRAPAEWFGEADRMLGGAPVGWRKGRIVWTRAGESSTDLPRAEAFLAALEHLAAKEG